MDDIINEFLNLIKSLEYIYIYNSVFSTISTYESGRYIYLSKVDIELGNLKILGLQLFTVALGFMELCTTYIELSVDTIHMVQIYG